MSEDIVMRTERKACDPENTPPLGVGFFVRPRQNGKKSKAVGHPVFDDCEWIRIVVPGDKTAAIERPASEADRRNFPRTYAEFKSRETPAREGMPIEEWPQVTRAMALTLKAMNIFSVEGLAAVSDSHIDKVGHNGRELRAKAQAFLAASKDTAAAQEFKAENEKLRQLLADQQQQISALAARLEEPAKRPGRPPLPRDADGNIIRDGNVAA